MKQYFVVYLAVLGSYLLLDFIWLGLVSQASYQSAIGHLMREQIPVWPWVTFYSVYSAVVVRLVIQPIPPNGKARTAFINGVCLGLAAYGAYNMTNYAILESWPLSITVKDWAWGTFVTGVISLCGFGIKRILK
ncbi:DUF2177 family protein [Alteromonas oceanisediminis]|uniref:DUF2177 family protein n=1 Tax=Alteromonas oceanisediminis TaxID=2836180 RepID=UPI001BD95B01|nr:DUF2177 family protein [Alteromonas oceanisediminis]MBT0587895.1 DUF2177 family protein [Alteromonas oceanisediminis]